MNDFSEHPSDSNLRLLILNRLDPTLATRVGVA